MAHVRLLCLGWLVALAACGSRAGDEHEALAIPAAAGRGDRISDVGDPASPKKNCGDGGADAECPAVPVDVTGAVVIAVDTYDETHDGKSAGTIYVQDLGSQKPYAGVSLYNPSFVPPNLRVGAGDTLDLHGTYQENHTLPVKFAAGWFLPQIATPVATFRFDSRLPEPVDLDGPGLKGLEELRTYESGRKWVNMLVRVKNVKVARQVSVSTKKDTGQTTRISASLLPDDENVGLKCADPGTKAPTLVNELTDISSLVPELNARAQSGTPIASITGVVTFFCNLHIAPRASSDIQLD